MDPTANLAEQRRIAARLIAHNEGGPPGATRYDPATLSTDALRLAELVVALDDWMKAGGFSPWPQS